MFESLRMRTRGRSTSSHDDDDKSSRAPSGAHPMSTLSGLQGTAYCASRTSSVRSFGIQAVPTAMDRATATLIETQPVVPPQLREAVGHALNSSEAEPMLGLSSRSTDLFRAQGDARRPDAGTVDGVTKAHIQVSVLHLAVTQMPDRRIDQAALSGADLLHPNMTPEVSGPVDLQQASASNDFMVEADPPAALSSVQPRNHSATKPSASQPAGAATASLGHSEPTRGVAEQWSASELSTVSEREYFSDSSAQNAAPSRGTSLGRNVSATTPHDPWSSASSSDMSSFTSGGFSYESDAWSESSNQVEDIRASAQPQPVQRVATALSQSLSHLHSSHVSMW